MCDGAAVITDPKAVMGSVRCRAALWSKVGPPVAMTCGLPPSNLCAYPRTEILGLYEDGTP